MGRGAALTSMGSDALPPEPAPPTTGMRQQAMEREADADIAAGRSTVVDGVDELIAHLDHA